MRTEFEKNMVIKLRNEGKSFKEIAYIMNVTINSVGNMYYYQQKNVKNKRGPKPKLTNYEKLRIKRQIAQYTKVVEKINATKI